MLKGSLNYHLLINQIQWETVNQKMYIMPSNKMDNRMLNIMLSLQQTKNLSIIMFNESNLSS